VGELCRPHRRWRIKLLRQQAGHALISEVVSKIGDPIERAAILQLLTVGPGTTRKRLGA
jgi:hypothetical protein